MEHLQRRGTNGMVSSVNYILLIPIVVIIILSLALSTLLRKYTYSKPMILTDNHMAWKFN